MMSDRPILSSWVVLALAVTLAGCGGGGTKSSGGGTDTTPPDTVIDSAPPSTTSSTAATFAFHGTDNVGVDHYNCLLDNGNWSTCTSPKTYSGLAVGLHTFSVRAYDAANNVDPTPASANWSIETTTAKPENRFGMNLQTALDWEVAQPFADVMKVARGYYSDGSANNVLPAAQVDADYWPKTDFYLMITCYAGTYTITFQGSADISIRWIDGSITSNAYDPGSDTTTATLVSNVTAKTACLLNFANTKRSAGDATGSGVTDIKIMQPSSWGSTNSYPPDELFSTPAQTIVRKTQVVRYMDFTSTNWNPQVAWSDRPLPAWSSSALASNYVCANNRCGWQGIGEPWEYVVLYANEVQRDAWINVPISANDDYIVKLAQLFAYGSDGVLPYTGPYGSAYDADTNPRPAPNPASSWTPGTTSWYPPLDPGLNLYVEYSNEVWNFGFSQASTNHTLAQSEVSAGHSPLNFDGDTNDYYWGWRRVAERGVQISNIFRSVFGDSAMPGTSANPRIRPVIETQQDDGQASLYEVSVLLLGFYDNLEGDFVGPTGSYADLRQWPTAPADKLVDGPHPPNYYFYGGGGSGYYNPDNSDPNLTVDTTGDSIWTSQTMDVANWEPWLAKDADLIKTLGLRRIAYEGGPSLDNTGNSESVKQAAWASTTMTAAMVEHQKTWERYGGDLLVYFTAAGDYQWGFVEDATQLSTPKMAALDQFATMSATAPDYGNPTGTPIAGNQQNVVSPGCYYPASQGQLQAGPLEGACNWFSYLFLANEPAQGTITVNMADANGVVAVYLDGVSLGQQTAVNGTMTFQAASPIAPGIHGIIVAAPSGSFTIQSLNLR